MTTFEQEAKRNERRGMALVMYTVAFGLVMAALVYLVDATTVPGFAAFVRCTLTARAGALCPLP